MHTKYTPLNGCIFAAGLYAARHVVNPLLARIHRSLIFIYDCIEALAEGVDDFSNILFRVCRGDAMVKEISAIKPQAFIEKRAVEYFVFRAI